MLPEHRAAARVQFATRARIWNRDQEHDESAAVETLTANLSVSGVLVERRAGLAEQSQLTIELYPDRDPTPIRCHAQPVRRTPTHLALKFTDLREADQTRLEVIIDRHQSHG